jgi:hypothetical protein
MNSFTFTTNGYYRIWCSDQSLGVSDEWHETSLVKPMGKENVLKLEQKKGILYYYLNGKQLTSTKRFPVAGALPGICCLYKDAALD